MRSCSSVNSSQQDRPRDYSPVCNGKNDKKAGTLARRISTTVERRKTRRNGRLRTSVIFVILSLRIAILAVAAFRPAFCNPLRKTGLFRRHRGPASPPDHALRPHGSGSRSQANFHTNSPEKRRGTIASLSIAFGGVEDPSPHPRKRVSSARSREL
jgi:hypothetical protein